jgi:hypothetical protein
MREIIIYRGWEGVNNERNYNNESYFNFPIVLGLFFKVEVKSFV